MDDTEGRIGMDDLMRTRMVDAWPTRWREIRVPVLLCGIRALLESATEERDTTEDPLAEATADGQIQVCEFVLRHLEEEAP